MATTAGTAAEIVQRRVYAYGGVSHTTAYIISILSLCQRVYNAFFRSVLDSTSLTVTAATPNYAMSTSLAEAVDVCHVAESESGVLYELSRVWGLEELAATDEDWIGNVTGTRYNAWCQIGRDLLFINPTKASNGLVSVYYSKLLDALTISGDNFEVSDDEVALVMDMAEIILLAQDKQLTVCVDKVRQFIEKVGLEMKDDKG